MWWLSVLPALRPGPRAHSLANKVGPRGSAAPESLWDVQNTRSHPGKSWSCTLVRAEVICVHTKVWGVPLWQVLLWWPWASPPTLWSEWGDSGATWLVYPEPAPLLFQTTSQETKAPELPSRHKYARGSVWASFLGLMPEGRLRNVSLDLKDG